jgi:hypothetical protein
MTPLEPKVVRWFERSTTFAVALCGLVVVTLWSVLFGNRVLLFTDVGFDSISATWPMNARLGELVVSDLLPRWDFEVGLGQNIYPGFSPDPFNLLFVPFGARAIPRVLGFVLALKAVLAGLVFRAWLRALGLSALAAAAGAFAYALSSQVITGAAWFPTLGTQALVLACALWSLERLLRHGDWRALVCSLAAIVFIHPFYFWQHGLVLSACCGLRLMADSSRSPDAKAQLFARFVGAYLAGVALSAVVLLPIVAQLLTSSRVGSGRAGPAAIFAASSLRLADVGEVVSMISRLFSPDLLGTGDDYRGPSNYYEGPLPYAGVLALMLWPQLLVLTRGRARALVVVSTVAAAAYVFTPLPRLLLNAGTGPTYRHSSVVVMLGLCVVTALSFEHALVRRRLSLVLSWATVAGSLAWLWGWPALSASTGGWFDATMVRRVSLVLLGYGVVLTLFVRVGRWQLAQAGVLALLGVELSATAAHSVYARGLLRADAVGNVAYFDHSAEALAAIHAADREVFRTAKDFHSEFFNDALMQHTLGETAYLPFVPKWHLVLCEALGLELPDPRPNVAPSFGDRWPMHALVGARYFLSRSDRPPPGTQRWGTFGDVFVFRSSAALPWGVVYRQGQAESAWRKLPVEARADALLQGAVLDEPMTLPPVALDPHPDAWLTHAEALGANASFSLTASSNNRLEAVVKSATEGLLVLAIPYDEGWRLTLDGVPRALLRANVMFLATPISEGTHTLELAYTPPWLWLGARVSVATMAFLAALALLRRRSLKTGS